MRMVSTLVSVALLVVMLSCAPSPARASLLLLVAAEAATETPQPCLTWVLPATIGFQVNADVQVPERVAAAMDAGQVKVFFFQTHASVEQWYCQGVQQDHNGTGLVSQRLTLGDPRDPGATRGHQFRVRILVSTDSRAFDCAGGRSYSTAELPSPDQALCPNPLTRQLTRDQ